MEIESGEMTNRPRSIPEQIKALSKRMQRIEDAITAKGIKFVKKNENYDYMPLSKVMDYVFELTGVKRSHWREVYYWVDPGLYNKRGRRVKLKYDRHTFRKWFTRKQWVRDFLEAIK